MVKLDSTDFYAELKLKEQILKRFDFSNYSEGNELYNKCNKMVVLKMKDELPQTIITVFVSLKPNRFEAQGNFIN